jgi:hypothetical protein
MIPLEALGAKTVNDTIVVQCMKSKSCDVEQCLQCALDPAKKVTF